MFLKFITRIIVVSMKNIRESCIELFKNEDIKRDVKAMLKPLGTILYNEIYIYWWILCFYHVFFIFIVLANFFLLWQILRQHNKQLSTMNNI
jgi:hypothetical protein